MLDELKPHDLHAMASTLGVHPFEVVRLMVVSGSDTARLAGTDAELDKLRTFGQMETWWTGPDDLPEDDNARRRVVRGMLDAMVQRELVGDKTTRLDNLWRGLSDDDREVAEQAVMILHEMGFLASLATAAGPKVSVHPDALDPVKDLIARGNAPDELAALWSE